MASAKTDYAEIQQNEIDVLRSIFMEDFVEEEVKPGAWNVCCKSLKSKVHLALDNMIDLILCYTKM
jgi:hypothetical protein